MKTIHHLAICLLIALGLSSCASPVERRIAKNPEVFSKLSNEDKALVTASKIREGMGKSAVFLSWGPPARVAEGKRKGQSYERWTYLGYDAVYVRGAGFGAGYGWGHGPFCDVYDPYYHRAPIIDYVPYDAGFVEFVSDRVTGWALPK